MTGFNYYFGHASIEDKTFSIAWRIKSAFEINWHKRMDPTKAGLPTLGVKYIESNFQEPDPKQAMHFTSSSKDLRSSKACLHKKISDLLDSQIGSTWAAEHCGSTHS